MPTVDRFIEWIQCVTHCSELLLFALANRRRKRKRTMSSSEWKLRYSINAPFACHFSLFFFTTLFTCDHMVSSLCHIIRYGKLTISKTAAATPSHHHNGSFSPTLNTHTQKHMQPGTFSMPSPHHQIKRKKIISGHLRPIPYWTRFRSGIAT